MNLVTVWLVIFAVFVIMAGSIYVLVKNSKAQKLENSSLKKELQASKTNLSWIIKHMEELQEIESEKNDNIQKLKEAKSDAEIYDLVNSIISATGNRM